MSWVLWVAVGLVAWCVVAVIVSLVLGPRLRRRSQTLPEPPKHRLRTPSPEVGSPDGSGPTRRQNGPAEDESMPTGDAFIERFSTPQLSSDSRDWPLRRTTERDR